MYISGMIGYLSEGWFRQWIAGLDRALTLPLRWAVPGHGPVTDPAGLRAFRDYLLVFARSARDHFAAGGSPSDYLLPPPYDRWGAQFFLLGNLTLFVAFVYLLLLRWQIEGLRAAEALRLGSDGDASGGTHP